MQSATETVLCTICARGGSKGVPGKNVRSIGGKPLLAHTVEHALSWGEADDVIVSTDDDDIATVAREYGAAVPFTRPAHLATDAAQKLPVVQHAVEELEARRDTRYDLVVDLDPTVPLRRVADIEDAVALARSAGTDNVQTATESERNPYYNMFELDDDGYAHLSKRPDERVVRRQDAPAVYSLNGAVAVYDRDGLLDAETILFGRMRLSLMPPRRSVAIDRPFDVTVVEAVFDERDS